MTQTQSPTALTPQMQAQLEQLKDIYLPEPISWWPLAMGWWVVIALLSLIVVIAVYRLWRKKRQTFQKNILAELHAISSDEAVNFVSELSALLKRVAIYYENNHRVQFVQNISGSAWANFLINGSDGTCGGIPENLAKTIAHAPYARELSSEVNIDELRQASETWILKTIKESK